jgi:succinate dehydrogenase / fumarate reductase cytochrome b subunit
MEETVTPPEASPDAASRWRRFHIVSGAVVLGAFLTAHLFIQASALSGSAGYAAMAGSFARRPIIAGLELVLALALAFHAAYGLHLLRRGRSFDLYGNRRRWVAQRVTAGVVFAFLAFHLWELRIQRLFFGLEPQALYTVLSARLAWTWGGVPWLSLVYIVALAAAAFHLSNGLFAATGAWGIATHPAGRQRVRSATTLLGTLLFVLGTMTVIGFATGARLLPAPAKESAPCGIPAEPVPLPKASSR